MKNIEVTNFKGNKYEGSWNEKTYSSNIADHPDLYRIYVNDQAIHITEKEYNRLIAGNLSEKMDRRRKEIETMSLYEKADILMTIFATGFGNKKDGLGDAFSSTALGSSYVRSLAKQLDKDPERISSDITKFIEKTAVTLYKETKSKELQVKANESFEDAEFLNEDDEIDYNKVQSFLNSHSLTDKEIWQLIESENGNAYYQTFERKTDENIFEICDKDFDDDGEYLYYE